MKERIRKTIAILPGKWWALAGVFGFFRTVSLYFFNQESGIAGSALYLLIFLGRLFLYTLLFGGLFYAAGRLFERFGSELFGGAETSGRRKWVFDYGVLLIGWLPHILIKYPGAMCWDTWSMLFRYGQGILNAEHSAFYSLMLGGLVNAFGDIGHPGWGLWMIILGQYALAVYAFGYSLQLLRRMGFRRGLRWAVAAYYLCCPYIIAYLGVVIKDLPFSLLVFLLTLLLIDWCLDGEAFCAKRWKLALLAFAVAGACLIRKNALFAMMPAAFVCLVISLKRGAGKARVKPIGAMLLGCALCMVINGGIGMIYEERTGNIREALSLPFQQTARFVRDYGDEIPEEEREIIDSVLQIDTLGERYNPRKADSVKDLYTNRDEMLPAYFRVWAKQFFRHPFCYFAATWEQNYYLFVPEASRENVVLYQNDDIGYELDEKIVMSERTRYHQPIFRQPPALDRWKEWAISEYRLLHRSIFVGTLSNIAVNVTVFIALMVGMCGWDRKGVLAFLPGAATILLVIAGPVIQGHPRYLFPVIYSMPALTAYTIYARKMVINSMKTR